MVDGLLGARFVVCFVVVVLRCVVFLAGAFAVGAAGDDDVVGFFGVRWRFGGAASANDVIVNAAITATRIILIVRDMFIPPGARSYKRYASANPICATNIMRYMCAHDTWFASTARSSGRLSMR